MEEENYQPLETDLAHGPRSPVSLRESSVLYESKLHSKTLNDQPTPVDMYLYNQLDNAMSSGSSTKNANIAVLPSEQQSSSEPYQSIPRVPSLNVAFNQSLTGVRPSHAELLGSRKQDESLQNVQDSNDNISKSYNSDNDDQTQESDKNKKLDDIIGLPQDLETNVNKDSENSTDQPFYVNAKQYYRILKRRYARAKLEENLRISRERRPYLHESRHKHAMRRPRGQGGRFLTAEEIKALKLKESGDDSLEIEEPAVKQKRGKGRAASK